MEKASSPQSLTPDSSMNDIHDANDSPMNNQISEELYLKCFELSKYFIEIFTNENSSMSTIQVPLESIDSIKTHIDQIVNSLSDFGKAPTFEISKNSSILDVYRLISCALLQVQNDFYSNENFDEIKRKYENLLENKSQEICENEQLKAQNQKLIEENKNLSDEFQKNKKIVEFLFSKYEIGKDSNMNDLVAKIKSTENDKNKLQLEEKDQEIVDLLTSKESQSRKIQALKKEIDSLKLINHEENINARIYVLETDINSLQLQNKGLTNEIEKQKDKNRLLIQNLQNTSNELKSKQIEVESLQMQLNKIMVERDDLKNELKVQQNSKIISHLNSKEDQIQGMNLIMEELTKQIEEMTNELSILSESRNSLLSLVHEQKKAIDYYDLELNCQRNPQNLNPTEQIKAEKKTNHSNDKIFEGLINELSDKVEQDDLLEVLNNSSQKPKERIIDLFSILLDLVNNSNNTISSYSSDENEKNDINELKAENERICQYLMTTLRFLDKVSNSSEVQDWMITSLNTSEIRDALIAQTKRVESFIKQRSIECDGLIFTELPKCLPENLHQIASKTELIAIAQQSSLANDVLRKYLLKIEDQMDTLNDELKSMKFELSHTESSIEDSTLSLREELEKEKQTNLNLEEEICSIRERLLNELTDLEKAQIAYKAGETLNVYSKTNAKSRNPKKVNEYVIILEAQLNEEISKNEKITKEITQISSEAKNEINKLEKQISELQEDVRKGDLKHDDVVHDLNLTKKELSDANHRINELTDDNQKLNQTIQEMTIIMSDYNAAKQKEIDAITDELAKAANEKISKLKEEIQQKIDQIKQKDEEYVQNIKSLKKDNKSEIKQLQNELDIQVKRANELRNHYEPLISEFRQKLNESREDSILKTEKIQHFENEIKELKNELSSTKIELKMNLLRLTANDEKMKREKSLFETQLKMKIMALETSNISQLEDAKTEYEREWHDFLVTISDEFKEFVDFNSPITRESTLTMLQNIHLKLNTINSKLISQEKYIEDIGDIKTLLELSKDSEILPKISLLLNNYKCNQNNQEIFDKINNSANLQEESLKNYELVKSWKKWAKRLHATITDEFSSQKSSKELQFVIEEALMSSIGQRQIWRHVEILRSQKFLLNNILNNSIPLECLKKNDKVEQKHDILTFSLCFSAIYRLQKLSGHLHGAISFHSSKSNTKKTKKVFKENETVESPKKYPILSFT